MLGGFWQINAQGDVAFAQLRACVRHRVIDDQVQIDGLRFERHQTGADGGDLDQVFDQAANSLRRCLDALDELPLKSAEDADQFAEQQVGITDDGRHRLS